MGVISQVIIVMQRYFFPTERAWDFITMSHQSPILSPWRISTSFQKAGANFVGLTAPGPDLFNFATQQEKMLSE